MSNEQRDKIVLKKIIQYCDEVKQLIEQCGGTKENFMNDMACRYACAMCMMQIGELSNRVSDEAKVQMSVIAWNAIRGMRNVLAHDYVSVNWDVIWSTLRMNLPLLRSACEQYLNDLTD